MKLFFAKIYNKFFKKRKWFVLFLFFSFFIFVGEIFALNTKDTGYRVDSYSVPVEVTTAEDLACHKITNSVPGKDFFIPSKTLAEWNLFSNYADSEPGLDIESCYNSQAGTVCWDIPFDPGDITTWPVEFNSYWVDSNGVRGLLRENCPNILGDDCDFNTGLCTTCNSHFEARCYSGDEWWYNSCSQREELKLDCTIYTCVSGQCTSCVNHASFACYNGDLYWYDSCGNRQGIKENCVTNCAAGVCNNKVCNYTNVDSAHMYYWGDLNGSVATNINWNGNYVACNILCGLGTFVNGTYIKDGYIYSRGSTRMNPGPFAWWVYEVCREPE